MKTLRIAAILSLFAPSGFAGEMRWTGGSDELNAVLNYGEHGTENVPISFYCTPEVDIVYVAYDFRPANASEGMEADFVLSAGGIDIPVGAIGYEILMDRSFVLEGQILFDQQFVDFISAPGLLTATAEGKTETFPLEGAREAARPLLEMCGRNAP